VIKGISCIAPSNTKNPRGESPQFDYLTIWKAR